MYALITSKSIHLYPLTILYLWLSAFESYILCHLFKKKTCWYFFQEQFSYFEQYTWTPSVSWIFHSSVTSKHINLHNSLQFSISDFKSLMVSWLRKPKTCWYVFQEQFLTLNKCVAASDTQQGLLVFSVKLRALRSSPCSLLLKIRNGGIKGAGGRAGELGGPEGPGGLGTPKMTFYPQWTQWNLGNFRRP